MSQCATAHHTDTLQDRVESFLRRMEAVERVALNAYVLEREIEKALSGLLGLHTFGPTICMCKQPTEHSHSQHFSNAVCIVT